MKFAICQELFEDWDWGEQCRFIAETGYSGIEVAPFTLARHPRELTSARRQELRSTAEGEGVPVIGLHWLLAKTEGLYLTSPDPVVQKRTADYLIDLTELCADLGGNLMVLGSPLQRNLLPGVTSAQAADYACEVFQQVLPTLAARQVDLLLEPLTTKETNFMNTCDEAALLIERVDHPRVALHQDVKAMLGEGEPLPDIIRRHAGITRHFHTNDGNLQGPGMGETDFVPIFAALKETGYDRWVSVEVFDYKPGAEFIARESLRYMQEIADQVGWK